MIDHGAVKHPNDAVALLNEPIGRVWLCGLWMGPQDRCHLQKEPENRLKVARLRLRTNSNDFSCDLGKQDIY